MQATTKKPPIYDIVRKHFPEKEYALMQEVRDAAGFGASRSADYMAMNLWPSRGLALHGIEQKTYRSDWTKELKSPEKADVLFRFCDYWWLLTTEDNVAKMEEIPTNWGWLHIVNGKIKVMKDAPKLSPSPITNSFLACLLKRSSCKEGFVRASEITEKLEAARKAGEESKSYRINEMEKNYKTLWNQVNEFAKFTGIDIGTHSSQWRQPDVEKIGGAVNLILKGGKDQFLKDLGYMEERAKSVLESIQNNIKSMDTLQKDESPINEASPAKSILSGS